MFYINITSAKLPVPHGVGIVVPPHLDILENAASYKIGAYKIFIKTLPKERECFKYLYEHFSGLLAAKLKEVVFIEPDIRKLMKNENVEFKMGTNQRKRKEKSLKLVAISFLGNQRNSN
ncbi:hypothetical protein AVEN_251572-1 [Araneus ventricosus]|uniref:Uncharacterized protein n=1 Tax=Araneus ventricosus TaxID=182803 RepID=A0A4Y2FH33_ARAVE|nr:hypothetical protein AVEN_251572-1 [Araneus ventricosus]